MPSSLDKTQTGKIALSPCVLRWTILWAFLGSLLSVRVLVISFMQSWCASMEVLIDLIKLNHADQVPRHLIDHIIPAQGQCAKSPNTRPRYALTKSITVNHVPKLSRVVDPFATSPQLSTEEHNRTRARRQP